MSRPEVTRELTEFAVHSAGADLPGSALHAGRRTVLNAAALAVGASRHPAVENALMAFQVLESPPQASILGRRERLGAIWAPLLNGIAMHVEDFDDTHLPTVIHPGAPVVPAALAAAELSKATGMETLEAITVGIEVALRVGNGVCPGHFERGWHLTGTVGHMGSAVAAGRLLGLDTEAMTVALGLAATQAAGLREALGTMTKSFHPGKAASNGIEAALLAREGFTGPREPIEGRRGFAEVAAPAPDYDSMLEGLGDSWEIEQNAFKPYACGIVSHPVIDGAISLRDRIDAGGISEVEVTVNPVVLDVMGIEDPKDGLQSKFSVYHCFAIGFIDGVAGPEQYTDARSRASEVVALRDRVSVVEDPSIAKDEARVAVRTSGGGRYEHHVAHATGSAKNPMSDEQLREKARLVAAPVLGEQVESLIDHAFRLDSLNGVNVLFESATP